MVCECGENNMVGWYVTFWGLKISTESEEGRGENGRTDLQSVEVLLLIITGAVNKTHPLPQLSSAIDKTLQLISVKQLSE